MLILPAHWCRSVASSLASVWEWAVWLRPNGETFYEPTGCLHRVSKIPAAKGKTRVLAVILHPRDAKQVTIPEPKKKEPDESVTPQETDMNIFGAGASGAMGCPLLAELVRQGHAVTGMTSSDAGVRVIA